MKWKRILLLNIFLFAGITIESEEIPVKEKPEFEISVFGIREKDHWIKGCFPIYPRTVRQKKIDSIMNN